ncbi:MAG: WXG100 family type VII secretion target [Bacteroidetes bacterium]|nr:WXG100 family type VII secretion target [Bacteroidota bacterium]
MFSGIFKLVFALLEGVVQQIMSQVRVIEDGVTSPLRAIVGQVVSGAWRGDGANRFVDEMSSEVIPLLINIMNINQGYASAIGRSAERMRQAERQATQAAQTLVDVFGQIY